MEKGTSPGDKAKMSPSLEDYLEAVFELEEQSSEVHMTDIAVRMNVTKASVNRAMGALKDAGYLAQRPYGTLHLTEAGRGKAAEVSRRHHLFVRFLTDTLGVSPATAEEDACRMEHAVSVETVQKLLLFMDR